MRLTTVLIILIVETFIGPVLAADDGVPENVFANKIQQVFAYGDKENLGVNFVVGNDLWLPGERFENGDDWLALACGDEGCVLEPAALAVAPDTWQGHYDDEPTAGQRLTFSANTADFGKVAGWFQASPAFAWLRQGAVTTYHSSMNPTGLLPELSALEAAIPLPGNTTARLVPLLVTSSQLNEWQPGRNYSWPTAVLQLRSHRKRQFLPGEFGACSGLFHPRNYLVWAGDLDRDDKPDYLISYVDADGPVHLFLSSAANPDQLVGLGGVFDSPPFGGECDGPEGFLYFDDDRDDSQESAN